MLVLTIFLALTSFAWGLRDLIKLDSKDSSRDKFFGSFHMVVMFLVCTLFIRTIMGMLGYTE